MKITGQTPTRLVSQPQRMVGDLFLNGQSKRHHTSAKALTVGSEHSIKQQIMLKLMTQMKQTETKEWKRLSQNKLQEPLERSFVKKYSKKKNSRNLSKSASRESVNQDSDPMASKTRSKPILLIKSNLSKIQQKNKVTQIKEKELGIQRQIAILQSNKPRTKIILFQTCFHKL